MSRKALVRQSCVTLQACRVDRACLTRLLTCMHSSALHTGQKDFAAVKLGYIACSGRVMPFVVCSGPFSGQSRAAGADSAGGSPGDGGADRWLAGSRATGLLHTKHCSITHLVASFASRRPVPAAADHDVGLPPLLSLRLQEQVCCPWTAACKVRSQAHKTLPFLAA